MAPMSAEPATSAGGAVEDPWASTLTLTGCGRLAIWVDQRASSGATVVEPTARSTSGAGAAAESTRAQTTRHRRVSRIENLPDGPNRRPW